MSSVVKAVTGVVSIKCAAIDRSIDRSQHMLVVRRTFVLEDEFGRAVCYLTGIVLDRKLVHNEEQ
jgi:hypothetical protein